MTANVTAHRSVVIKFLKGVWTCQVIIDLWTNDNWSTSIKTAALQLEERCDTGYPIKTNENIKVRILGYVSFPDLHTNVYKVGVGLLSRVSGGRPTLHFWLRMTGKDRDKAMHFL